MHKPTPEQLPSSSATPPQKQYACDTLPPPQNMHRVSHQSSSPYTSPAPVIPIIQDDIVSSAFDETGPRTLSAEHRNSDSHLAHSQSTIRPSHYGLPQARKLCVRHQRMADRGTNLKLQQSLDALPIQDRANVTSIWSTFSSSSHPQRELILNGLLQLCCFSQLLKVSEQMFHLTRLDPFTVLPREIALRVLGYLDAISLCRAAQVCRQWNTLANDDILWKSICEQHIGQKCHKCGWGLPMLERRRKHQASSNPRHDPTICKRDVAPRPEDDDRPRKRQRSTPAETTARTSVSHPPSPPVSRSVSPGECQSVRSSRVQTTPLTRPWKDVYCERLTIERNWRRGRCTVRTLKGHTDGVMCVQFNETLDHPSFPVLISGSYDRTARVWNMETGIEVRCLKGHSRAIRALQFDNVKLITGSMDHTMRVWDWRTGRCLRILEGHTEGVVCLNFDSNVLASGSVDTTVKIWNFRTGVCFTLRGHHDWVNSVQLWNSSSYDSLPEDSAALDQPSSSVSPPIDVNAPNIDPGKMLFSASDDGMIRLWDLTLRTCVRQFAGHVGQVQSLKLLLVDPPCGGGEAELAQSQQSPSFQDIAAIDTTKEGIPVTGYTPSATHIRDTPVAPTAPQCKADCDERSRSPSPQVKNSASPVLVSGSLDSTIRLWDIENGSSSSTLFGHIEGVWSVAGDKLRLVSGSHDRTIKVWAREEGQCVATLFGHSGAVTCLSLGDDKIVSGSDDHDVRIWDFSQ